MPRSRVPRRFARTACACLAASASIALAVHGCVPDFRIVDPAVPEDAGSEADGAEAAVCPHATFPPPPSVAGGDGQSELVAAIRSIDLGEVDGAASIGLDLDLSCTCQGEAPTCVPLLDGSEACDGPEGRDVASAPLLGSLAAALGTEAFGSQRFSEEAESGGWSVLVRVRGYNGGSDDDAVRLDWLVGAPFMIGGSPAMPAWDGNDAWPISTSSLTPPPDGEPPGLDDASFSDPNAYVSGGTLVAALPEVLVVLSAGNGKVSIRVSGAVLTARIEPVPGVGLGFALRDGTLAGRWTMDEVFRSLGSFRDVDGLPYCTDGLFYDVMKQQCCGAADILAAFGSPASPCDAISFAVAFETYPAVLGDIVIPPVATPGCPLGTDPAADSCG